MLPVMKDAVVFFEKLKEKKVSKLVLIDPTSPLRNINDIVGFSGIEKYYEHELKGYDGLEYHIVDRFGIDQ